MRAMMSQDAAMSPDQLAAFSTAAAAVSGVAALAVTYMSYRMSTEAEAARKVHSAHELDAAFTSRLEALYPGMRAALGSVEDGIPDELREVVVPFFILYSDAWKAHNDGLLADGDWEGLGAELRYWAQKPVAREAWSRLRLQTWAQGFGAHVDDVMNGARAYPDLTEAGVSAPVDMADAVRRLRAARR